MASTVVIDKELVECCSTNLIDGDGIFNADGLDNFIQQVKLEKCGISYAVVAIMGPQSSGKSTLLNHLFHTNFEQMDAEEGRSQTTKGIWIAKCAGIEPCTIVMDLEGNDGRERGEDDTVFEKQISLFALAVSDIVLINMWCHDIGREQGANKPLLKIVFQVMLRLFSPRKTTLMFVIRDKTKTRLEKLEPILREDIQKIWNSFPKPEAHKQTPLSEFFNVQVIALSNYEEKEEQFKDEVASLRQKFFQSVAPGGLAGDRRGVIPASGFSLSSQQIWKVIKENKDLDLPAHKVMVATIRCEEIAKDKYSFFVSDENWLELEEAVKSDLVPGFGKKLSSLIDKYLSSYDEEATYFEDTVRSAKRKQLEEKLLQLVQPAYHLMLEYIQSKTMNNFKNAVTDALSGGKQFAVAARDCIANFMRLFDEQCEDVVIKQANWDSTKVRDIFSHDLDSYIVKVQIAKMSEVTSLFELRFRNALYEVDGLLNNATNGTWLSIKTLLDTNQIDPEEFSSVVSEFEMEDQEKTNLFCNLKRYGRGLVKEKATQVAKRVEVLMKDRYKHKFSHDNDSNPRVWGGDTDIPVIAEVARSSTLELLSVLAAIRLDGETDTIYEKLMQGTRQDSTSHHLLAMETWGEVETMNTLITPIRCKLLWEECEKQNKFDIAQAMAIQRAREEKKVEIKEESNIMDIVGKVGAGLATRLEKLEPILREDIQKIWNSFPKPEAHKQTPLSEFFNVQVVALSNYEEKETQFKDEVASLRQKFFQSVAPGGLAGDRRGVIPASGFSLSSQQIWKVIKENKDLDLPAHKVMVATIRCEEIAKEKYSFFVLDENWLELEEAVKSDLVPGFGKKLSSLIDKYLSSYDEEATYFEDTVRSAKRKQLEEKLLQLVQPAYHLMLEYIQSKTMNNFKNAVTDALCGGKQFAVAARDCIANFMRLFDEQCEDVVIKKANWDSTKVRDIFSHDLDSYIVKVRIAKLSEVTSLFELRFRNALYEVDGLLNNATNGSWLSIKILLDSNQVDLEEFSSVVSEFEMEDQEKTDLFCNLKRYGRGLVKEKATQVAKRVEVLMKDRYKHKFSHDNDSNPRVWGGDTDIPAIAEVARSSTLELLSVLAAIRLDGETDTIYEKLMQGTRQDSTSHHMLALDTWGEHVETMNTLITPIRCKLLWEECEKQNKFDIAQAMAIQRAREEKKEETKEEPSIADIVGKAGAALAVILASPILGPLMAINKIQKRDT